SWAASFCRSDVSRDRESSIHAGSRSRLTSLLQETSSLRSGDQRRAQSRDLLVEDAVVVAVVDRYFDQVDAGTGNRLAQQREELRRRRRTMPARAVTFRVSDEVGVGYVHAIVGVVLVLL